MPSVDYLVVGSGLTGSVIARHLHDAGRAVVVVDRRNHVGGNVHDHLHAGSGIRVHTYGPHYFRTNNRLIWDFVNRFASFYRYEAVLVSEVDGQLEHWPINEAYLRRSVGDDWKPAFVGTPSNFEEASLAMMPEIVYEKFVKGYTEKQWGVPATSLDADLAGRFDVRQDGDVRLKNHEFQGIPVGGYAAFMEAMLDGIPVELGVDAVEQGLRGRRMTVFTGPIDEWYNFDLGRLAYRGQRRHHRWDLSTAISQPYGQVNNPSKESGDHVRTLEWRHMAAEAEIVGFRGTVLTTEHPFTPDDPNDFEYPFPDRANRVLYERYRERAAGDTEVMICGRLGEYRYYDMDQAIGRANVLARRLLQ